MLSMLSVSLVAAASMALSYHALSLGADRSGAVLSGLAWLVPIAIDGLQERQRA